MAILGEYTFIVTNLLTGKVIDEVELSSMHWTDIYNKPGSGQATARIHHPKTTKENFNSWNNGLWVLKDGDIRFGGYLGKVQPRSGTGVIEIPVLGFMEYLRQRVVYDNSNMDDATFISNDIKWENKEQFDIASDVVDHTQQGDGNIGLSVIYSSPSGILRDETISVFEQKYAGDWFEGFAARINGFGWAQEYYYDGDDPKCRFRLTYPRTGRSTDFDLTYEQDSDGSNIVKYDLDGGQQPITGRLVMVGAGEGDDMVTATIIPASSEVAYDAVITYKDVSVQQTLVDKGYYHLAARGTPARNFTISIDWNRGPFYTEFAPGDEMDVHIDDGFVQVDSVCTTISKQVTLSPQHDEDVKVSMIEVALL